MCRLLLLGGSFSLAEGMLQLSFRVPVLRQRLARQKYGFLFGSVMFFDRLRPGFRFALRLLPLMTLLFKSATAATAAATSAPAAGTTVGLLIASAALLSRTL